METTSGLIITVFTFLVVPTNLIAQWFLSKGKMKISYTLLMFVYVFYMIIETTLALRDPEQFSIMIFNVVNLWAFAMAIKGLYRLSRENRFASNESEVGDTIVLKMRDYTNMPHDEYHGNLIFKRMQPTIIHAIENNKKITVDLDGVPGYATSFMRGFFIPFLDLCPYTKLKKTITFVCTDEPGLISTIWFMFQEQRNLYLRQK